MKPIEIDDPRKTTLAAIELKICDAIDEYNDAVATGNDELAQFHAKQRRQDGGNGVNGHSLRHIFEPRPLAQCRSEALEKEVVGTRHRENVRPHPPRSEE